MKLDLFLNEIKTSDYLKKLAYIYCTSEECAKKYADRLADAAGKYKEVFKADGESDIVAVSAPGRTEIGGNHTDHQRGKVLTGSVDVDALCIASPNGTNIVNVYSEGYGLISVDLAVLSPVTEEKNTTQSLVRGVAAGIAERGYDMSGFNAYVISNVPGGSGISSSACFEVLIGTAVNALFCSEKLSMPEIARIGQHAENEFFGKPSGLMDQMGCAVGGIVTIDFADKDNPVFKHIDFDFASAGYSLCIVDSGADHADLTDDYAAVPQEMKNAAKLFGREVLSEVDEEEFWKNIPKIREEFGDRAVLRAYHYFEECRRVDREVEALENNDFAGFLDVVKESGRSSFMYLQNISTYRNSAVQPVAVAIAAAEKALAGNGAVRVHGGGFAGTIQAFVPEDMVDGFRKVIDGILGEGACKVMKIRPVGGTVIAK